VRELKSTVTGKSFQQLTTRSLIYLRNLPNAPFLLTKPTKCAIFAWLCYFSKI